MSLVSDLRFKTEGRGVAAATPGKGSVRSLNPLNYKPLPPGGSPRAEADSPRRVLDKEALDGERQRQQASTGSDQTKAVGVGRRVSFVPAPARADEPFCILLDEVNPGPRPIRGPRRPLTGRPKDAHDHAPAAVPNGSRRCGRLVVDERSVAVPVLADLVAVGPSSERLTDGAQVGVDVVIGKDLLDLAGC